MPSLDNDAAARGQPWRCDLCEKDSCLVCRRSPFHAGRTCAAAKQADDAAAEAEIAAAAARAAAEAPPAASGSAADPIVVDAEPAAAAPAPAAGAGASTSHLADEAASRRYLEEETRPCPKYGAALQKRAPNRAEGTGCSCIGPSISTGWEDCVEAHDHHQHPNRGSDAE